MQGDGLHRVLVCEVSPPSGGETSTGRSESDVASCGKRVRPETSPEHKIRDISHVDSRDENVVILYPLRFHASVAQMVEQLTCNQ